MIFLGCILFILVFSVSLPYLIVVHECKGSGELSCDIWGCECSFQHNESSSKSSFSSSFSYGNLTIEKCFINDKQINCSELDVNG